MKFLVCVIWILMPFLVHADPHKASPGLVVETLVKSTNAWNGDTLPAYLEGQPEVTILRFTVPPKTSLPWHEHPVINAGVLISGSLVVVSDEGEEKNLSAGEPLIELVNKWHRGENRSDEPAVILVFYAGIEGLPTMVLRDPQ
jgi:quercetin dioxygenase-like cupin family protein